MTYPIDTIRSHFPALHHADAGGQLPLFLDGPGGNQVPQAVLDAMVGYLGRYNSNFGGYADAGLRTSALVGDARAAAADSLIAATALEHGFVLVTRNVGDFAPTGVQLVNPWQ